MIHRAQDPLNGDNVINIFIGTGLRSGVYGIELRNVGTQPANFHAWIERDDDRRTPAGTVVRNQSKFVAADQDPTHTLGSISCGADTITVGSYSATVTGRDLSDFTAEGPTRDAKKKPEVSAPGQNILAAESRSVDRAVSMSGTSMAAPHVTGLVALVLQSANAPLTIAEIRQAVINSARRNPPNGSGWHPRYGNGRVDVAASVLRPAPLPTMQPFELPGISKGGEFASPSQPLSQFLQTVLNGAPNSLVRITFEIDVSRQSQ